MIDMGQAKVPVNSKNVHLVGNKGDVQRLDN